ncbi:MAG: PepSY-associated TM helix domain-containing protein [Niveispirillum sp.]|uniref:PepSY-associated TM helix domain-containing protein n=1 Tax=Niveispirillum sp. TaxID=1917217 RepID=UPI003BA45664
MKGFRQTQSALHTWTGLLVGWVLFMIFLAGTISFWREEVSRWMRPELSVTSAVRSPQMEQRAIEGALAALGARAPNAASWAINMPGPRGAGTQAVWTERTKPGERRPFRWPDATNSLWVDGNGQVVPVRETRGGDFFYRLHFDLHYMPALWARWFVGFCSMFMLVAIVTGVITHKKIFRDFFTFRPGKGQRSWLDGHNVTAVLALPFHLMITYTGLVTLMTLYLPWGFLANFDNTAAMFAATQPDVPPATYAGAPAPLAPIGPMLEEARRQWGDGTQVNIIRISNPGDRSARVQMGRGLHHTIRDDGDALIFDGVTGALLGAAPSGGAGVATRDAMVGIHAGRFAPITVRWLYFLSGLAGTVMVATGLVMWTAKRREKLPDPTRPHFGFRLVERLNVGTVAGLPLGMVALLWANRVLPVDMAGRWPAEVNSLFIVWGLALLHAFARPPRRAWVEQFALTGILLSALPFYDQVTGRGLWQHIAGSDATRAWTDVTLLALGLSLAAIAHRIHQHRPAGMTRRTRASREAAVAVAGE